MRNSENISPTAYATGYFWYRHGLSHRALVEPASGEPPRRGGTRLLLKLLREVSGPSVEALMLTRHRGIDALLARAIQSGAVSQVIEIAAGLSPRGWAMKKRFGEKLTYLETDLPAMAKLKRQRLESGGLLKPGHEVLVLDALADKGARSLEAVAARLSPKQGTAIITEGLLNYLPGAQAQALWRRIARTLQRFPKGVYLADAYLRRDRVGLGMLAFGAVLQIIVRGRMYLHFGDADDAAAQLSDAGFARSRLLGAADLAATRRYAGRRGADRVHVLEAWT